MNHLLAIFSMPSGMEWLVALILGLLLFGRRLPDVARSVGRSIVEFKKGIREVRDEVEDQSNPTDQPPQIERKPPEGTTATRDRETTTSSSER